MVFDFLKKLQQRPQEERANAVLAITFLAALLLIPVGFWHLKGIAIKSEAPAAQLENGESLSDILGRIGNPLQRIDEELKNRLGSPAAVISAKSVEKDFVVHFRVENGTFSDLVFPAGSSTLVREDRSESGVFQKVTGPQGEQWVPVVAAGEVTEGIIYFTQVSNGTYILTFKELQYRDENQTPFDQEIVIEVTDALKVRS